MKSAFGISKKFCVVASTLLMSAFVITSCDNDDDIDDMNNNMFSISGNANGTQMVPAVTTNGTGTISGTYNANTNTMTYTSNWANLSGAPSSGGFYTGASGSTGVQAGSAWTMGTGLTSTGSFNGTMTLTEDQETQMRNGNWYYSMGTANNANGEVRGQITATQMP